MPIRGTSGDDRYDFSDYAGRIEYFSGGGSDSVVGSRFDDIFHIDAQIDEFPLNVFDGGAGDDTFFGSFAGRTTFIGGAGADTLVGGTGRDVVSYAASARAVDVDLLYGAGRGGEANGDVYALGLDPVLIDDVIGSAYDDTLIGTAGDNVLTGGAGDDWLSGDRGRNTLIGGAGADEFLLQGTADSVDGGAGVDHADYREQGFAVLVDLATGANRYGATGDRLVGVENVSGSRAADTLRGDDGANVLAGNGGADVLEGRGGADTLIGDGFARAVYTASAIGVSVNLATGVGRFGDAAGDRLDGVARLDGSDFADTLHGAERGGETIAGWDGDDRLVSGGGRDTLLGGNGADRLEGSDGGGLFNGGIGDDRLVKLGDNAWETADGASVEGTSHFMGHVGFDIVDYGAAESAVAVDLTAGMGEGGAARDTYSGVEGVVGSRFADDLSGDARANLLGGGRGQDVLVGGAGADTLAGGAGTDTASYAEATDWVVADLVAGGSRADALGDVFAGVENLEGSQFGDWLYGTGGGNVLSGLAGDDVLVGDSPAATGAGGDDTLVGGSGWDRLHGRGGDDTFAFRDLTDSGHDGDAADVIFDWGDGDVIDLRAIDADPTTAADDALVFVGTQPYTGFGEVSTFFSGGDTYVELHVPGGPLTDMTIRLAGQHVLTAEDFVL